MSKGVVEKSRNLAWTTFGRYALLEKIGSGGMAEIYRAKTFGAAGFEKEFAIKLILPSLVDDKEFVEMFINEAKIAVSLYHANIVQVFDLGELDGQYYIAMEFVHGMDLLDVLARCAHLDLKIPLDLVLFITMEMLKGLDFAHRAKDAYGEDLNIIHRDVSPSNVLMSYAGDVKIGDFGVAKAAIQRNLTESGTLKGKVGYMSPEQVVGEEIDARSDIFSAGIVFFEALSMSRLFVGNSDLDVMLRVRDADIDPSLKKVGPLPTQLEAIVRRALARHREERYQTAGEFYQALVDFCFQHRIQVNGSNLSNFMRRLFAEEIEQEKSRRMNDMDGANERQVRELLEEQKGSDSAVPRAQQPRDSRPRARAEAPSARRTSEAEERPKSARRRFRYRDSTGLIYGPMGQDTLVKLLEDRQPEEDDRVSIDGSDWVSPYEVAELEPHLGEPQKHPASRSVPAGAAVYRPGRRSEAVESGGVGDEETIREPSEFANPAEDTARAIEAAAQALEEISNNSEANAADSMDFQIIEPEMELGESSSPVLHRPVPHAIGPTTAEEAKKVISKLREQYASYEGNFHDVSFARLLARLHRSGSTGRLHVQDDEIEKSIYIENGEPILVDSNKEDELLGFFLLSRNVITQEQLEEGLARLSEWGGRLGDALVAIGAIPAHEIYQHLSDQMREKILDVFTWTSGEYGYFENQQPETHGYPLGIDAYGTIVEGCLERMPYDAIKRFYGRRRNMAMFMRDQAPVTVEDLRLSSKALRIVKQYEPGDSLARLVSKLSNGNGEYVYRVVYLLHQVELFTFEVTEDQHLPGPDP